MQVHGASEPSILRRYEPTDKAPWNVRRVVHLHRRAGFAATWSEIQRDCRDGPELAVGRIIRGGSHIDGTPAGFDQTSAVIADAAVGSGNANRLKAWWLYRMLFSADALTERLTLMWHNHFATSNLKVSDVALMRRQNEVFREFARAPFGDLLSRAAKDPALLVWLDAEANRQEHPNENLAREIMELFTLGVGNYTELDVKQAARALTGWSVRNGQFHFAGEHHDPGKKSIFGKSGNWTGDDLVQILLDHPATARRLAFRICELLMGEGVRAETVAELASALVSRNLDIGWAVETVLRSEAFFADANISTRVLGPVEYGIGAARALEMFQPPPSTLLLAEWCATLGQDLFYPPNVFGWPGGRAWLGSRAVIGRINFAASMTAGTLRNPAQPWDAAALAARHGATLRKDQYSFYSTLLLGHDSQPLDGDPPFTIGTLVPSMLASPEAQLA